ncbi:MAG: XRE family transcriptional regulator [Planktomarina sp.]
MEAFCDRLKSERNRLNLTQIKFAEIGGVAKSAQINYESGKRKPDIKYISKIQAAGVDTLYLLTGNRTPPYLNHIMQMAKDLETREQIEAKYNIPKMENEYDLLPVFEEQMGDTGAMFKITPGAESYLSFSKDWMHDMKINAETAFGVNVVGDSMAPTLVKGDTVLIDGSRTTLENGCVYAIYNPDKTARIKRLELGEGVIAVHSDNPDKTLFPTEYLTGDAADVVSQQIVGQVVWSGHKWV